MSVLCTFESWGNRITAVGTAIYFRDLDYTVHCLHCVFSAFSAALSRRVSITQVTEEEVVVFSKVTLNLGNHYNSSSGVFTAPSDGVFVFTCDLQTPGGARATVHVMRNDQPLRSIRASGRHAAEVGTGSGTVAVALASGDLVYVLLYYDGGYSHLMEGGSRFTGFKLW